MASTPDVTIRMKLPLALLSMSVDFSTIPHSTQTEARLALGDKAGHGAT
jgi:hypothetical protein